MNLNDPTLLRTDSYINGAWTAAPANKRFAVTNPATGETIAEVADLGAAETTTAIDAAVPAQKAWAARTAKDRAMVMRRWYEMVLANAEDLAVILTTEMGKPIAEARGEVAYGATFIDWFAEEARRVCGDVMESPIPDKRFLTFKQPVGVFGAHYPVEFSDCDDHPQGLARHRRRVCLRPEACRTDTAVGAGTGRTGPPGGHSGGRDQHRHRHGRPGHRIDDVRG